MPYIQVIRYSYRPGESSQMPGETVKLDAREVSKKSYQVPGDSVEPGAR